MSRPGRRGKGPAPGDALVHFGEYLRRERELREISLEEVSRETRIGRTFLESIEGGRVDTLPPLTFVKGFLRAYAGYVGLDANDVLLRFEQALMGRHGLGFREGGLLLGGNGFSLKLLGLPLLIAAAVGLLALATRFVPAENGDGPTDAWFRAPLSGAPREDPEELRRRLREELGLLPRPAASPGAADPTSTPGGPGPGRAAATSDPGTGPAGAPPAPMPSAEGAGTAAKPRSDAAPRHVLAIEGIGPTCWLRIVADGGAAEEKRIEKGRRERWEARERFQITVGDAGGVKIHFDGQDLGVPGRPGEVLRLTLPGPEAPGPAVATPAAPPAHAEAEAQAEAQAEANQDSED